VVEDDRKLIVGRVALARLSSVFASEQQRGFLRYNYLPRSR
jgi:hypothetical protein